MYWSNWGDLILALLLLGGFTLPLSTAIVSTQLAAETDASKLGNHIPGTYNDTTDDDENQANHPGPTKSVQACDDFFSFVCNNVTEKQDEEFSTEFEEIIETQNIEPLASIKNFYRACAGKTSINERDLGAFKQIIFRLGRLKTYDSEQPQNFKYNWTILARNIDAIGYDTFWRIEYKLSQLPEIDYEIWLYPRKSLFHRHNAYNQLVESMMLVGVSRAAGEKLVDKALKVERAFDQLRQDYGIRANNNVHQLKKQYPWMNWQEYMSRNVPSHILIDNPDVSTMLFLPSPMDTLTKALNTMSPMEIAGYLKVRFIDDLLVGINSSKSARSAKCEKLIKTTLPKATDIFYSRKYYTGNYKKEVEILVSTIRRQTAIEVTQAPIPKDCELRKILGDTVKTMKLGIELEFCEDREIEKRYKGLVMSEDDFMGSFFNLTKYRLDSLDEPDHLDFLQRWIQPIKTRYGFIGIPANIFRTNYFRENQPMYLNYAGIGRILSKKLLHAAVSRLKVNMHEHLKPLDELLSCQATILMKRLYDIDLDSFPNNTLYEQQYYERLSLKSSYVAYQTWQKRHNSYGGTCEKHPNVDSSSNPMFWMGAMKPNCQHSKQNMRIMSIANFMDLPEFRDDFHCPNVFEDSCLLPKENWILLGSVII